MRLQGTYVSGDEVERADAERMGYGTVCQHPNKVDCLGAGDVLVIDLGNVPFDEKGEAAKLAYDAARAGVPVGVHTYDEDDLRLGVLATEPLIVIARTHRKVRAKLRRLLAARPVEAVTSPDVQPRHEEEDHDHEAAHAAGPPAGAPAV